MDEAIAGEPVCTPNDATNALSGQFWVYTGACAWVPSEWQSMVDLFVDHGQQPHGVLMTTKAKRAQSREVPASGQRNSPGFAQAKAKEVGDSTDEADLSGHTW